MSNQQIRGTSKVANQVCDYPHAVKEVLMEQLRPQQTNNGSNETDLPANENGHAFNKDLN